MTAGGRRVPGVQVELVRGSPARIHALDPFTHAAPTLPGVWWCRFDAPAIVLGSRQSPDLVDRDRCAGLGFEVAKRRSGGGAVLLRPDAVEWFDLVVPPGVAPDDVRGSMVWAGEIWRDVLVGLGAANDRLDVHRGGLVGTAWSDLVCFAGVGPGEVLVGGRKLVGLSQRRTRHGVRVQCLVHRASILGEMPALFAVPTPAEPLPEPATFADIGLIGADGAAVLDRLVDALERTTGSGRIGANRGE